MNFTQEWLTHHILHLIWNQYGSWWRDQKESMGAHNQIFTWLNSVKNINRKISPIYWQYKWRDLDAGQCFVLGQCDTARLQADSHNYLSHATHVQFDGSAPCNCSIRNYLLRNLGLLFFWNWAYFFLMWAQFSALPNVVTTRPNTSLDK